MNKFVTFYIWKWELYHLLFFGGDISAQLENKYESHLMSCVKIYIGIILKINRMLIYY